MVDAFEFAVSKSTKSTNFLTEELFNKDFTPKEFCASILGRYLQMNAGTEIENLPSDIFKTLVWSTDLDLREYCRMWQRNFMAPASEAPPPDMAIDSDEDLIIILHEATISALALLFKLANDPSLAGKSISANGRLNRELLRDVDLLVRAALQQIMAMLYLEWDEVGVVLGCSIPIVVKHWLGEHYWHMCAAEIPNIQEHEDIEKLSTDAQPGDKVGEWTVDDIELE
ncbi:hypothetical protein EK21DRAFT_108286 [Setomelanomma holmii]|uniref:Uncharacterized protein n=1 Tax=Setomelanomma holmii TaxID=210430 RepID=A0A9P4LRZ5_9PLEO|nr:hypothetical protein EK21DRAFT_108286 [Setomelanomma holmii]